MANEPDLPDNEQLKATGAAVGLGCSIVVTLILFIGGGALLDTRLGTGPMWTLIGVAVALVAAGYELYELARVGRRDTTAGPLGRGMARLTGGRKK